MNKLLECFDLNADLIYHHSSWDAHCMTVTSEFETTNGTYINTMQVEGYDLVLDDIVGGKSEEGVQIEMSDNVRKELIVQLSNFRMMAWWGLQNQNNQGDQTLCIHGQRHTTCSVNTVQLTRDHKDRALENAKLKAGHAEMETQGKLLQDQI